MNKVRIAISPVGPIALNDLRSALFNVAFARRYGGNVLLRFLDVAPPPKGSGEHSERAVVDALAWLGLTINEGPHRQLERRALYRQIADKAVANRLAYPCFCTLTDLRKRFKPPGYDRKCFFLSPEEARARMDAGEHHRIRLINPSEGEGMFVDAVRGPITWNHANNEDQVLITSENQPGYAFAAAVDDHEDGITDVIQGEEWLVSTTRQSMIHHALGWELPRFAHLPLLLTEGGEGAAFLYKDEAPAQLQTYRNAGTHPDALLNYLAWPTFMFDDQRQKFTLAELAQHFDFGRIGKMQPQLDTARLTWLQEQYSR